MKKTILFLLGLGFNILLSCYPTDKKNEAEPYPTYDTNSRMEPINDSNDSTHGVQEDTTSNRK